MIMEIPSFATPVDPDGAWMMGAHGPTCVPARRSEYDAAAPSRMRYVDIQVNQPGLYGRYLPVDMDVNNRHSVDEWCKRNPDSARPRLGWSVCRQGFGRQDERARALELGADWLTEAQADAWAVELNRSIPIGAYALSI